MNHRNFIQHWILVCLGIIGLFVCYQKGFVTKILEVDISYTSLINLGLVVLSWFLLGYAALAYKSNGKLVRGIVDFSWFLGAVTPQIGLVGTVVGCLAMFSGNTMTTIDSTAIAGAFVHIISSLSIVFYTTIVGIIASLYIKTMTYQVESFLDDETTKMEIIQEQTNNL